jgi:hypothetical protein
MFEKKLVRSSLLICGDHRPANSWHSISMAVPALALILSVPAQCQIDRVSSLTELIPNATLAALSCPQPEQQSEQEQAPSPSAVSESQSKAAAGDTMNPKAPGNPPTGTSNDRLFKVLPNFLTLENAGQLPPLTTGQKFKAVARGTFDYVQIPWYGLLAGLSQAENSEPGYGQGAVGYGKRYGAYAADGTIENFMVGAVLASLLRQDPRFYQSGKGTAVHRVRYAVSRIFITRSDAGHQQFNYSEIFGSAISAGISTYSYHPRADRTVPNTLSVWGSQVAYDTISIVIKEFWPDIRRKLSHKSSPETAKL